MKICTVLGARPQFIKAAALSRKINNRFEEIIIHTGQHYDYNMSDVFFEKLCIPTPAYNLGINGKAHGRMTGEMLIALESVFIDERPQMVIVYGDTNSTLAGALAAIKLHIPVCHIEAGVRMGTLINPEEVNRVLTDRISKLLMCCTNTAVENLKLEGITDDVYVPGDLMYDALLFYGAKLSRPSDGEIIDFNGDNIKVPENFYLLTCHREENTADDKPLSQIFQALESLEFQTIYPVHPRNKQRALKLIRDMNIKNIILTQPVGYLTSLYLVKNAHKIITDSGGLQREAFFYNKQCITLLDNPVWPETFAGNMNQLCRPICKEIIDKLEVTPDFKDHGNPFGAGDAAQKIVCLLERFEQNL